MPFKDHERKLQWEQDWRSRRTPEYHRWLGARRALRLSLGEHFREEIGLALRAETLGEARQILLDALDEADRRLREVGNRFDHERNEPYFRGEERHPELLLGEPGE